MEERKRITPALITELKENEIFVFGSNIHGMHGGGAARIAYQKFGAEMGNGEGLQGQSYALPTMEGLENTKKAVDNFIICAKAHKELIFLVTPVGCGIAGFRDSETGRFEEVMLLRTPDDLEWFKQRYGISGEIEKIY